MDPHQSLGQSGPLFQLLQSTLSQNIILVDDVKVNEFLKIGRNRFDGIEFVDRHFSSLHGPWGN